MLLGIGVATAVIFGPWWWRPVNPCVIGDMTARAQARVPDKFKEIYFDAERIQFGLGSAAIGGWESLGDAVAAGGVAWVRTTNVRSPKYYDTVSNRYFQSNGFVFIPPGLASAASWRATQPTRLASVWEVLAKKNPEGVMFTGYVRLAPLRLIAIARPAIDGQSVLKNAPYYYTHPMESAPQAWAYVVGIAAANTATARADRDWLSSLLAGSNPSVSGVGLAYALWLKSAPVASAPPRRADVRAVGQLMADATIVAGDLKLFPVTRAAGCDAVARAR